MGNDAALLAVTESLIIIILTRIGLITVETVKFFLPESGRAECVVMFCHFDVTLERARREISWQPLAPLPGVCVCGWVGRWEGGRLAMR